MAEDIKSKVESNEQTSDFVPQWGTDAPRGGKTVVNRALKDGSNVPLFLGQTLINSLRDMGYNSTTSAVCEHVDNSIESGATEIRIYFRQIGKANKKQKIDILVYDNGSGMDPRVLKVAMAFGGSMRFDSRAGIGRYGMGMKAAALNITRSFDVYSWQEKGAFYSMSMDVDEIGRDQKNLILLPEPSLTDTLPSEISSIFHKAVSEEGKNTEELFCDSDDQLTECLDEHGTIVYMEDCDRLSYRTGKTLAIHAIQDMGRIYRRFLDKGLKIFINNKQVEVFDPTYWLQSSRHNQIPNIGATRSNLVDSFDVAIPLSEESSNTTTVRVRMYLLPVREWAGLPRTVQQKQLQIFEDHMVSYLRNDREVAIGSDLKLDLKKHQVTAWLRVEIAFSADADEAFGVASNKQGVRLKNFAAAAILEAHDGRFGKMVSEMRKRITAIRAELAASRKGPNVSEAERLATDADSLQRTSLPMPQTDTQEQILALEANLRKLATSLRQEGETDEDSFARLKSSKYVTDIRPNEYAPFYDTDFQFGKLILKINSAHLFYQKVWQPLTELAKSVQGVDGEPEEGGSAAGEVGRRALTGLQMMLLSLARVQTEKATGDQRDEYGQLFRNLRRSWSDVLETQLLNV